MNIDIKYDINEDLSLGWTVVLSKTVLIGNTSTVNVMIYPLDVKPTARQMRKFKNEFRKDSLALAARMKDEIEWEDCIIDILGWDVE